MNKLMKPTILSISLVTIMAGAAVAPALGSIALAFTNTNPVFIKMILTIPAILIIFISLLSGKLTEKFTKKSILIVGLLFYICGGFGGSFANSIYQLLFSRVILGVGVGLILPLSTTLIADFFSGDERTSMMGFSQASANLGGIITTILSGALSKISWRYAFYVYLIGVLVLILIIFVLPEPERKETDNVKKLKVPLPIYKLTILAILTMVAFYAIPTNMAIFIESEKLGDSGIAGIVLSSLSLAAFIAGMLFTRITKTFKKLTIFSALIAMSAGYFGLSLSHNIVSVTISIFVLGLGFGVITPTLLVKAVSLVPKQSTTIALSIISSGLFIGQFISPIIFDVTGKIFNNTSIRFGFKIMEFELLLATIISLVIVIKDNKIIKNESNEV